MKASRLRFRVETAVAVCAGVLGIVTAFWHDWIEALTGWDPDHHNGSVEWLIVAALLVISAALGALARREWRLLTAASEGSSA